MKKLLTLTLLILSPLIVAQEKEIWACQQTEVAGLIWGNGSWTPGDFGLTQFLFTIDDSTASMKLLGTDFTFRCDIGLENGVVIHNCSNTWGGMNFILNPETGQAGFSALSGALQDDNKDTMITSVVQCTKF